ncbi:MAG TPA: hypothetical protein VMW42_00885 [Desulfatiglandales bacterium]|nr:hypothetical protein [Desulfatiglandales bacterium]
MKIKDKQGNHISFKGLSEEKINELDRLVTKCLEKEPFVLVCTVGNKGIGKSTFGRYIRLNGFGSYKPNDIAVIDDGCMSVEVAFFFRKKYVNPCNGVDELRPFYKYCKNKRVRFYIDSRPENRITKASILLRLYTDEERRLKRLIKRKGKEAGTELFLKSKNYPDKFNISYQYELEVEL